MLFSTEKQLYFYRHWSKKTLRLLPFSPNTYISHKDYKSIYTCWSISGTAIKNPLQQQVKNDLGQPYTRKGTWHPLMYFLNNLCMCFQQVYSDFFSTSLFLFPHCPCMAKLMCKSPPEDRISPTQLCDAAQTCQAHSPPAVTSPSFIEVHTNYQNNPSE